MSPSWHYRPHLTIWGHICPRSHSASVDLETTGAAETDMITEVGAVKVRGGEVLGEFQTLVNPKAHIPPLIAVLTGITNQMVANAPQCTRCCHRSLPSPTAR